VGPGEALDKALEIAAEILKKVNLLIRTGGGIISICRVKERVQKVGGSAWRLLNCLNNDHVGQLFELLDPCQGTPLYALLLRFQTLERPNARCRNDPR
jgi:hypothetical protein